METEEENLGIYQTKNLLTRKKKQEKKWTKNVMVNNKSLNLERETGEKNGVIWKMPRLKIFQSKKWLEK